MTRPEDSPSVPDSPDRPDSPDSPEGPGGPDVRCADLVELLGEYLEGTLTPGRRDELDEHLRGCRGCSAVLDQLRTTVGLLGGLPAAPDELPDDVRAGLGDAFDELRRRGRL